MRRSRQYEFAVVAILCLAYSIVNFEFLGINYLMPFIAPSLRLSNSQIGIVVSAFWVPFGLSSYLASGLADRLGKRQSVLLLMLILFSACSVLSGLAISFATLLAARLLMGVLEGPVLPLAQSIIALESADERRGVNMGIVQTVGAGLMSGFVAPLLLVELAVSHGWRIGFFVTWIPGLLCAALIALYIREPARQGFTGALERHGADVGVASFRDVLRLRNIWLCSILALLFVAHSLIGLGYLPLFFIRTRHFLPQQMSVLMSVLGVSSIVLGIAVPAMADRIGRKPTAILASLLGTLCPLAALYYSGPLAVLGLLMFVGWAPVGASILYMATIPAESVPARSISTAIGFTFAVGTLIGGGAGPTIAGWAADHWGLRMALFLEAGIAVVMALISLGLRETKKPIGLPIAQ